MIQARNLIKSYLISDQEIMVLQNVNVTVDKGEFVALLGPSGSGKTTLLSILGLIDVPTGGELFFNGQSTGTLSERAREKLRRGNVSFVFENFNLIEELTVFENVELPLLYLNYSRRERHEMVNSALERFRLTHRKKHYPSGIGPALQQKAALARASVFKPAIIFADEPTGNLNASAGSEVMELLSMLNEQGQTIVMATHSASQARLAQRVIQLFDGHVLSTPENNLL